MNIKALTISALAVIIVLAFIIYTFITGLPISMDLDVPPEVREEGCEAKYDKYLSPLGQKGGCIHCPTTEYNKIYAEAGIGFCLCDKICELDNCTHFQFCQCDDSPAAEPTEEAIKIWCEQLEGCDPEIVKNTTEFCGDSHFWWPPGRG
ncbi:hypothetical protein ACFL96_04320 [Thermoproteota archaeon]